MPPADKYIAHIASRRRSVHELPVAHSELLDPATLERLGPLLAERLG
jgi:hypothetical protein